MFRTIICRLLSALTCLLLCPPLWAQDTTPRGPTQWTARMWLGFFIYIGVFILAVIGIYKLAGSGEDEESKGSGKGNSEK